MARGFLEVGAESPPAGDGPTAGDVATVRQVDCLTAAQTRPREPRARVSRRVPALSAAAMLMLTWFLFVRRVGIGQAGGGGVLSSEATAAGGHLRLIRPIRTPPAR